MEDKDPVGTDAGAVMPEEKKKENNRFKYLRLGVLDI